MTLVRGASELAGWGVERWAEIQANTKTTNEWSKGLHRTSAQVYAVALSCDRLIVQAAKALKVDGLRIHQSLVEGPSTGRIWIVEADYTNPFWKHVDAVPPPEIEVDPDLGGIEIASVAFGVWPAIVADVDMPDRQAIVAEVFLEWRSKLKPWAKVYRCQPVFWATVEDGLTISPADQGGGTTAWIVAATAFVKQRLISLAPTLPGRGTRKRLAAVRPDLAQTLVNVVTLRATDQADHDHAESQGREWKCRWLVNEHWRNQYHPSTGEHVPTWIMPYVKGPADKPFVAKDRRIAVVR